MKGWLCQLDYLCAMMSMISFCFVVFIATLPLLFALGTFANPTFRYEDGVVNPQCPSVDDPRNPIHLPHPTDCGRFLKCFNGRAFTIPCPPGEQFGVRIQRCDYPQIAQCRTVLAQPQPAQFRFEEGIPNAACPRTDDPMRPIHLRHPTSCRKFMKCFSGKTFELDCPPGQEWAAALNRCDYPSVAMCSLAQRSRVEEEPAQQGTANEAVEEVKEEQPVEVVEEVKEEQPVEVIEETEAEPEGVQEKRAKILPMKAEFVYSAGIPNHLCPLKDDPFRPVHLPHDFDCSKFQKCFDGRAYVISCPPGQQYGPRINRCDYPQFAQCSLPKKKHLPKSLSKARSKVPDDYYYDDYNYDSDGDFPLDSTEWTEDQREMILGISDIRCPKEDDEDSPVHLVHPKDCGKFYKCYNGRAYLIMCPPGQHWSVRFDRCEYPKVAKCTIRP